MSALAIGSGLVSSAFGHNLDTTATSVSFADDFVAVMTQRAAANQPLIQQNDEFWVLLKTTPGPGTTTGVGGYQTFYVPPGVIVTDAAYVFPDGADPRGFRNIPMKGQSPIAIGNGSISPATSPEFVGWSLPGVNGLGVKFDPVSSSGAHRGTLAGVYADTGIFYSTDPRTVFNSYGMLEPPLSGPPAPMQNNSGDTVGEWYANNIADAIPRQVLGVMNLWDSYQLRAYGRKDVSPLLDSNGRGNAPWGLANVVAGPQSGYAWEFDYDAYQAAFAAEPNPALKKQAGLRAAIKIGPWNRVRYPGSQISSDQPGLISNLLGQAGIDASLMGIPADNIPPDANAIRFAIGQLELGRPEFSAVKVKIVSEPSAGTCWSMHGDAFGGDAGGSDGGKDHIWRYYDPTVVTLKPCAFLQKVASKALVAPGETFHYDIVFANNGTDPLPNVVLTDVLPAGLIHVSALPVPSSGSGLTWNWNLGTVQPGDMVSIRQYVKATGTGTLFNTVTARSNGVVIGVAKDSVEVGVRAILNKSKSVTPGATAPGQTVAYTLEIENVGSGQNGTPLRVREFLPPGFTYQNLIGATLNGSPISSPTLTINATNPAQPFFDISQAIQPGKKLFITFNALVGPNVQPGTYWNSFQLEYEGKIIPPIPEAPVIIGGAQIGDMVWRDWNGNGTRDAGESGLPGVTVTLTFHGADGLPGGGDDVVTTETTDSNGNYLFTGLLAGNYQVAVPAPGTGGVPAGYSLTGDPDGGAASLTYGKTLADSEVFLDADWGYQPAGSGTIGDQVFEDLNKNGLWQTGETGIPGVAVDLYIDNNGNGAIDSGDLLIATDVTDGSGEYTFPGLDTTLDYLVRIDANDPAIGAHFTTTYGAAANEATGANPLAIGSGFSTVTTADFGFWRALPATIGDQVFIDNNLDGAFDPGDDPLGNVTVNLYAADGVTLVATTASDLYGQYLFNGVAAGTYIVKVDTADADIPAGFSASVLSYNPTVAAGESFLTADFPFISVFNKQVDKASALPNEVLTYTMTPYWPGPTLLTNAQITDAIPAGTTFTSAGQGGALSGLNGAAGVPGSHPGSPGSGSVTLVATKDTSIDSANPTLNYGASTSLTENRGGGDTLGTQQILAQFDLAPIPAGATLTGAQFKLTKTDSTNPAVDFQIYPLLKSWTEGTGDGVAGVASFNQRMAGTAWSGTSTAFDKSAPSADFGNLLAQTTVNGAGTYTWSGASLLSQVQSWYSTPANNFGLVLGSNASGTTDTVWNSRESSGPKPELVVNYTATAIPATTTTLSVSPSSVLDSGSGVNVTVSMTVTATGAVSNISPSALTVIPGANGATATFVSGPTGAPASISTGGGSATFTWVYKVFKGSVEDQVRFGGAATGTGATFSPATSNGVVVKDASISASVVWNLGSNSAAVPGSDPGSGAVAGSASLTSVEDNEIWSDQPTTNYGGLNTMWIERTNTYRNRLLIRFDLSSIPSNATITSSVMRLTRKSGNSGNTNIAAHRLNSAWGETTSSWNNRLTATPWAAAGGEGDYHTTAEAITAVSSNGNHNWTLTSLTQGWVDGTYTNNGVIMRLPNETLNGEHEFHTSEATDANNRPLLTVNYTTPGTPATTTAISVSPVLVTDSGAGAEVSVSMTVTSAGAVSNITPPLDLTVAATSGAGATRVSGPTGSPASIGTGGGSATFTWVYNVTAGANPGQVTFAGAPTGNGANFGTAISHGVIVTPPLNLNVTVNNPPGVGFVENTAEFYNGPTFLAEDTAVTALSGSIGDFVWADTNADGLQDAGEVGIPGMTVLLYAADGTTQLDSTTTDSSGFYRFYGLAAGNYLVRYDSTTAPVGYFGSTPVSLAVPLSEAQQFNEADFGLYPVPSGMGSIGDFVWIDADNDGVQDGGESPLEGVAVILERRINGAWTVIGTDTTDANGLYAFTGLSAGEFRATVDPSSQIASPYADGTFNLADVMAATYDLDGGTTAPDGSTLVTLSTDSTVVTDADFGYNWSGSIGDFVWWDDNTNGQQDEDPLAGIQGARVELYHDVDNDGVLNRILGDLQIGLRLVDANGYYTFQNLPPGNYIVDVYEDSFVIDGIRNVVPTTEENVVVSLAPGGMDADTADFGYFIGARAEALVFWDENHNGIRDGGEPLLADVPVTITGLDKNGNPVDITTNSSATGYVAFLVPAGHYTISYDTAQLAALYPALGIPTTLTSFEFEAEVGEDGIRFFEFGVDNTGAIGDTIFADLDGTSGSGVGPGAGDPGLNGVTVNLYLDQNGDGVIDYNAGDLLLATTLTDAQGNYLFTGLPDTAGNQEYMVEVVGVTIPASYQQIASSFPVGADAANNRFSTTLIGGAQILDADFGYPLVPDTFYAVSGTIYDDNGDGGGTASNGLQEPGEAGIENVEVTIEIDADGDTSYEQIYVILTDSNGDYSFSAIPEGADVRITVDQSTLPSTAYVQTGDPDGAPLSNIWIIEEIQVNATDLDFGYVEQPGSIAGTIVRGDGDGIAEPGEDPVQTVTVTLTWFGLDGIPGTSDDVVSTTTTDANGFYEFTGLLPGGYEITTDIPSGLFELADRDGFNPNSINVNLTTGENVAGRDFEYQASTLAGTVRTDTNGNGQFDSGEPAIPGVTVFLDLDGNGVLDPGEPSTSTNGSGEYSFGPFVAGDYEVRLDPSTLPSGSIASYDPDGVSSIHVAAVTLGINQDVAGQDFGYYRNGSIGNLVWIDANHNGVYDAGTDWGINGITVELYQAGQTPGVDTPLATQSTSGGGGYQFTDLAPGSYFIYLPTHPASLPAVTSPSVNADNQIDNDNNGSQSAFAGPVTGPILQLDSGESDQTIDIGYACQGTWEEWRYLNPLGGENGATDNPEDDRRDNLLEFSLRQDPVSGIGDGFEIRPSTTNPGTIEAVFNRPIGATKDVRYVLEYAPTLGTPTIWGELDVSGLTIVTTPISACTEQVIIPNLETITGLIDGKGFVRIRVELDEDGNDTPEATSFTETEGWTETPVELCCRTYNVPYLRGPLFTGTVGSVSGQTIVFPGENLDNLLASGISYYVEVTTGDNEGHRYDVISTAGETITLANDTDLFAATAPYNTVLGVLPSNLAGDTVILRRHWTLAEIFPPGGFGATDSSSTADMVQIHVAGGWQLYWLYDEGDANPATARWVKVGDNTLADQGGLVVPPGQGMFLNSRNTISSMLAYGEVRENDFRRPLQTGPNLVGGGYPLDQSLNGTGGRNMNLTAGFDGDRDFKKADRVMIWQQDTNPLAGGYDTFFLLDGSPVQPALVRWVKVGDVTIQVRDSTTLFPGDRAAFYQMMGALPGDIDPAPWTP